MNKRNAVSFLFFLTLIACLFAVRSRTAAKVNAQSYPTYQGVSFDASNNCSSDGSGNSYCDYTVSWGSSFGTANYAVTCTPDTSTADDIWSIYNKTSTTFVIRTGGPTTTFDCIGVVLPSSGPGGIVGGGM